MNDTYILKVYFDPVDVYQCLTSGPNCYIQWIANLRRVEIITMYEILRQYLDERLADPQLALLGKLRMG